MTIVVPKVPVIIMNSNPMVLPGSELLALDLEVGNVEVGVGSTVTGIVIVVVSYTVVVNISVSLGYIPIQYGFSLFPSLPELLG